jgi:hypothetical protein
VAQIRIAVLDPTGTKKTIVELPDDIPMNQLIPALVGAMNLPTTRGGNPVSYRLDNVATGSRLANDETLAQAEVEAGTVLSLFPEITAGGSHERSRPTKTTP